MHIEIWEKIHNSLGSELKTNHALKWMSHVLSLSYNDLSHELKTCLLYLGMYPEDYKIRKIDLVRKWIAEGFIREKHGLDLEEVAENCFNELINRSMIQPCFNEDDFDKVWACQVHDLMLDLIILKCKEENFITIIDKKYLMNGASQVRRISHQFRDRNNMPFTAESMSASIVRSYISFPVADCFSLRQFLVADCFLREPLPPLSKFQLLRVLDMEHSFSINPMCLDLSAINHLFLLSYVRVHAFRLELPKKFGKLKHLMTLDMLEPELYGGGDQLSDFNNLSSLRHLILGLSGRVALKNGLSKLCNLSELSGFDIGTNSIECIRDLSELINLRNLHVADSSSSRADGVENNPKMTILAASLNKPGNSNLRTLAFNVGRHWHSLSAQFCSTCLSRPRHLQRLQLFNLSMPKLPNWIVYADRLAHAVLGVQELRSDDVRVLAQLPCLIYLNLTAITFPENNIIIHPNTFHRLNTFRFFYCGLPRLTFEPAAMPQLQRLKIELSARGQVAMQLQEGSSTVSGIEHLASLEEITCYIHIHGNKCGQGSKIESAWRDGIRRHPKYQAMQQAKNICVLSHEYDD